MSVFELEEQRRKLEEATRRGMALLAGGFAVSSKQMLTEIVGNLHRAMHDDSLPGSERIYASKALFDVMFSPNFPDHWFEQVS